MKSHAEIFPIEKMAKVLEASKSAYYAYLHHKPSARDIENEELLNKSMRKGQASPYLKIKKEIKILIKLM